MPRLSTLVAKSGGLHIQQKEVKEQAYLEYLKSFSLTGMQTLEKLEKQFNASIQSSQTFTDTRSNQITKDIYKKMFMLISSYQIFILEINDSCEFVQISEFGQIILKVFVQMIGIVKWCMKDNQQNMELINGLNQQLINLAKRGDTSNRQSFRGNEQILNTTMQNNNRNSRSSGFNKRRDTISATSLLNLRTTFNNHSNSRTSFLPNNNLVGNINDNSFSRCSQCGRSSQIGDEQLDPKNIYQLKQQTTLKLKDITQEVSRMQKEFKQEEQQRKKEELQRIKLKQFIEDHENNSSNHSLMKLLAPSLDDHSASRNEQILSDILCSLNRKGQAIGRFADLRFHSLNQSLKIEQNTEEDYEKFKLQLQKEINSRVQQAKLKLAEIFKQRLIQHELQKLNNMKSFESNVTQQQIQKQMIKINPTLRSKKINQKFMIKKLQQEVNLLTKQLEYQKDTNESLKKLLQQKSVSYEQQIIQYRNELIALQCKSKRQIRINPNQKNKSRQKNNKQYSDDGSDKTSFISIQSKQQKDYTQYEFQSVNTVDDRKSHIFGGRRHSKSKRKIMFQFPQSKLQLVQGIIQVKIIWEKTEAKFKKLGKDQSSRKAQHDIVTRQIGSQTEQARKMGKQISIARSGKKIKSQIIFGKKKSVYEMDDIFLMKSSPTTKVIRQKKCKVEFTRQSKQNSTLCQKILKQIQTNCSTPSQQKFLKRTVMMRSAHNQNNQFINHRIDDKKIQTQFFPLQFGQQSRNNYVLTIGHQFN